MPAKKSSAKSKPVEKVQSEDYVFADAAEAQEELKTDYPYGERRADGEIEGVTVNTDRYAGPRFDNLKEDYKNDQLAASQAQADIAEEEDEEDDEDEDA